MSRGRLPESAEKRSVYKVTGRLGQKEPGCFLCVSGDQLRGQASDAAELDHPFRIIFLFDRVAGLLAAEGMDNISYSAVLYVPEGMEEKKIRELAEEIVSETKKRTEIPPAIQVLRGKLSVATLFLIGVGVTSQTEPADGEDKNKDFREKQTVLMVGFAAKEATAYLIHAYRAQLLEKLTGQYLDMGLAEMLRADMRQAIAIARQENACVKLAGEGGIFTALWQLGEYLDCGMEISLSDILLCQETIEVCEILDCNPYLMCSTGCFLAVTEHPERLIAQYHSCGIRAAKIGLLNYKSHDRIVCNEEERRFLEPFRQDDFFRYEAGN